MGMGYIFGFARLSSRVFAGLLIVAGMVACSGDGIGSGGGPTFGTSPDETYIVLLSDPGLQSQRGEAYGQAVAAAARSLNVRAAQPLRLVNGFLAEGLDEEAVEVLRSDPRVAFIERDQIVEVTNLQVSAPWNLDRIDQRLRPLDDQYGYGATGRGVTAYVVDTGIRSTHDEFSGRVAPGFTAIEDGIGTEDCRGHGTHVAGIIGGAVYGVAKEVTLVPVRVLDCNGTGWVSSLIAGLDWIMHVADGPTVVNLSLGANASSTLDAAVRNVLSAGIPVAVAAGNSNADACDYSPARVPDALTVGAIGRRVNDNRAAFSNYGACLDVFAPGSEIYAAGISDDASIVVWSGTSMASPHVAGAAALLLELKPAASVAQVRSAIVGSATEGVVTDAGAGSPNLLLFTDPDVVAPPPPPPGDDPAPIPDPDPEPEPEPEPGDTSIHLTVTVYKVRGLHKADLAWSGTSSTAVNIYRDGEPVATVATATGNFTDNIDQRGGGTYTYHLCEVDGGTGSATACSSTQQASF